MKIAGLLPGFILFFNYVVEAKLYDIVEPDALSEFEEKAKKIDIKKLIPKPKIEPVVLTPAKKKSVRYIDPTYCLDTDIKVPIDNRDISKGWRVLYPKGYCFNPIDYIPQLPPKIIVFNPCDKKEVEFVKKNGGPYDIYLMASCFKYPFEDKRFLSPLSELSKKQFGLRHTISIIEVDKLKRSIKIEEVPGSSNN